MKQFDLSHLFWRTEEETEQNIYSHSFYYYYFFFCAKWPDIYMCLILVSISMAFGKLSYYTWKMHRHTIITYNKPDTHSHYKFIYFFYIQCLLSLCLSVLFCAQVVLPSCVTYSVESHKMLDFSFLIFFSFQRIVVETDQSRVGVRGERKIKRKIEVRTYVI